MKLTLKIEGERPKSVLYGNRTEMEPYTVADCADLEFAPTLLANILRAAADEVDPPTPVEYSFERIATSEPSA